MTDRLAGCITSVVVLFLFAAFVIAPAVGNLIRPSVSPANCASGSLHRFAGGDNDCYGAQYDDCGYTDIEYSSSMALAAKRAWYQCNVKWWGEALTIRVLRNVKEVGDAELLLVQGSSPP